jgi:signal transduction histidine kinase
MAEHNHVDACTACEETLASERAARAAASTATEDFLVAFSHDLRGRLNAITGWVDVLRTRIPHDDVSERAIETIERNAWDQARLIKEMLERIKGRSRTPPAPADPGASQGIDSGA